MSSSVPEGWELSNISSTCEVLDSKRVPLNSQERSGRQGVYPYYGANGVQGYIDDYIFEGEHVLLAEDGGNFDQWESRPISYLVSGKFWVNNHAHILKAKGSNLTRFIHYSLVHKNILKHINGGTRAKLNQSDMRDITLLRPPPPEQQKIATILSTVDDVIEKTRAQIDKLKDLKTGMMQELLTKGIGPGGVPHTEFKDSPVGRIPVGWKIVDYASVVRPVMPSFILNDDEEYSPVVVRRRHMGVETRETKLGSKILVKSQYRVVPGTFLISKRQIYHGSCGLVPFNIGDKAIISKEYLALETTDELDVRFLNYFSYTNAFHQQIVRTTYDVDVEKFVFKDQWWMKELIPLPSRDEQNEISNILDSMASEISLKEKYLVQVESVKKAIMQDLLTGKVRVNVDNMDSEERVAV